MLIILNIENLPEVLYSFEEKIEKVRSQLINGEIKLLFDSKTASCNLVKSG